MNEHISQVYPMLKSSFQRYNILSNSPYIYKSAFRSFNSKILDYGKLRKRNES